MTVRKILALPMAGAALLIGAASFVGAIPLTGAVPFAGAHPAWAAGRPHAANAAAATAHRRKARRLTSASQCSAAYFHGDARLGPARLPVTGEVGAEFAGYRRTGGLSVPQFLATYWSQSANAGQGGWIYPPDDGYVIGPNGHPLEEKTRLFPGQDIDRFGSEYGTFLSPENIPYRARSIPPQSLEGTPPAACNYHRYRVIKGFAVDSGPIAPWFAQPGDGWQYQLDPALVPAAPTLNVMWLVNNGYLRPLS